MTQFTVTPSGWTLISPAGSSGACWLDDDGDGKVGSADIRILQSIGEPTADDVTKGRRVFTPNGNNDFITFSAKTENHGLYAMAKSGQAIISVDDGIGIGTGKLHSFNTEPDGAIRAQLQDNQAELVGIKVCQFLANITLAAPVAIGDYTCTLVAGHGSVAGNIFCLKESGRHYQATILNVATNVVTLDTPMEFAFTVLAVGFRSNDNMALSNGSVTPAVYRVSPPIGAKWDLYGFSIGMTDNIAMDDGRFGGIAALTRGLVVRKVDGVYKNIFNCKTNGDFAFRCDEVRYADKPPAGTGHGISIKKTFSIRHGCVIRLDGSTGDELQFIVQDDLTALSTCRAAVWGHVVS